MTPLIKRPKNREGISRPALSKSCSIRKIPFYIDFDESISDRRTSADRRTDRPTKIPTDKTSFRDADASKKWKRNRRRRKRKRRTKERRPGKRKRWMKRRRKRRKRRRVCFSVSLPIHRMTIK